MKKYLKNLFEFYGISSSQRKDFYSDYLKKFGKAEEIDLQYIIKELWAQPQREYQYFAMELLRKFNKHMTSERLELFEFIIVNKAWWDTVDFIASNLVGAIFLKFPELKEQNCQKWMLSGNIWLQRTVLLFQLKYRLKTDTELLSNAINDLAASKEFFIRKAIGWSLREYSKINPDYVGEFVNLNNNKLSNLSIREALKVINKKRDEGF